MLYTDVNELTDLCFKHNSVWSITFEDLKYARPLYATLTSDILGRANQHQCQVKRPAAAFTSRWRWLRAYLMCDVFRRAWPSTRNSWQRLYWSDVRRFPSYGFRSKRSELTCTWKWMKWNTMDTKPKNAENAISFHSETKVFKQRKWDERSLICVIPQNNLEGVRYDTIRSDTIYYLHWKTDRQAASLI